jgi:ERCC4-related helicase
MPLGSPALGHPPTGPRDRGTRDKKDARTQSAPASVCPGGSLDRPRRWPHLRSGGAMLPQLDRSTATTWFYPRDERYEFRPYQHSMAKTALEQNTLVSIPTGTGKTLIAAVVLRAFLRWYPDGIVVFMAPTRPLIQQQRRACCKVIGLDVASNSILVTGETPPAERQRRWAAGGSQRLVFCTPHILKNDLERRYVDGRRIVCCVYDEAHHAGGGAKTIYAQVARLVRESGAHCRVLALSATAGTTLEKVQAVVDALHLSNVEVRTEEALASYLHQRAVRVELIRPPNFAQPQRAMSARPVSGKHGTGASSLSLRELLLLPGEPAFVCLRSATALPAACELVSISEDQLRISGPNIERRLLSNPSNHAMQSYHRQHRLVSALVTLANLALGHTGGVGSAGAGGAGAAARLPPPHGARAAAAAEDAGVADENVDEFGDSDDDGGSAGGEERTRQRAAIDEALGAVEAAGLDKARLAELRELALAAACGRSQMATCDAEWLRLVPKLRSLTQLLQCHFASAPASRVIAFVARRTTVSALCTQLSEATETRGIVRAAPFVGRGRRAGAAGAGAEGMDQAAQQRTIDAFKAGENVLVATSVAEEGLDIGEVDLIICFDTVNSPIRLVQRLGRTGRQRAGQVVMLLSETERREYDQTVQRAKQLADAVDSGHGIRLRPCGAPLIPVGELRCEFVDTAKTVTGGTRESPSWRGAATADADAKENCFPRGGGVGGGGVGGGGVGGDRSHVDGEGRGGGGGSKAGSKAYGGGTKASTSAKRARPETGAATGRAGRQAGVLLGGSDVSSSEEDEPLDQRQRRERGLHPAAAPAAAPVSTHPPGLSTLGATTAGVERLAWSGVLEPPVPLESPAAPPPARARPSVVVTIEGDTPGAVPAPVALPEHVPETASEPASSSVSAHASAHSWVSPWSADVWLSDTQMRECAERGSLPPQHRADRRAWSAWWVGPL